MTTMKKEQKMKQRPTKSGFAKKRFKWLIGHSTSHQLLWYINSFVLQNTPVRQAPKRYGSPNNSIINLT